MQEERKTPEARAQMTGMMPPGHAFYEFTPEKWAQMVKLNGILSQKRKSAKAKSPAAKAQHGVPRVKRVLPSSPEPGKRGRPPR